MQIAEGGMGIEKDSAIRNPQSEFSN